MLMIRVRLLITVYRRSGQAGLSQCTSLRTDILDGQEASWEPSHLAAGAGCELVPIGTLPMTQTQRPVINFFINHLPAAFCSRRKTCSATFLFLLSVAQSIAVRRRLSSTPGSAPRS